MGIVMSVLAVAFAALCVWLTVRIINRRERWARWTLAVVLLLVSYPLSAGPVDGLDTRGYLTKDINAALDYFYGPLVKVCAVMPEPVRDVLNQHQQMWY